MNLARKLLTIDAAKYKELKTGKFLVKGLSAELGEKVEIEIKQLDDDRAFELQCNMIRDNGEVDFLAARDVYALICAEGVTEPNLADVELMKHYGAATPAELAKILFKGDELQEVADAISNLGNTAFDDGISEKKSMKK